MKPILKTRGSMYKFWILNFVGAPGWVVSINYDAASSAAIVGALHHTVPGQVNWQLEDLVVWKYTAAALSWQLVLPLASVRVVLQVVAVGAVVVAAGAVAAAPRVSVVTILVLRPPLRRHQGAVGQGGQGHSCSCALPSLGV